jgi:hypothetical protein
VSEQRETAARRTPYELVFGVSEFEAQVFPRVQEEARERGVDERDPERFAFLSVVGDAVRSILPAEAPAEALEQYRLLLFHSYNFWRYGKRVYFLEQGVARYLVEAAPMLRSWELEIAYPAVYVQLPANLFWGSISPESTPEPLDGFFVTCLEATDALGKPFRRLEVLAVLGIRRDRAGFSIVPFATEAGPGIPEVWAEASGRDDGKDFENLLPGGEMAGLYSVLTTAEALKLLARAFWYVDAHRECVNLEAEPERRSTERPGSPPRPALPYFRVSLGATEPEPSAPE